jgi:hypothetical protein
MTLKYFSSISGADVGIFTDYLMQGMALFQDLTKREAKGRPCSQIVIVVSARMITPTKGIVAMNLNYAVSSDLTS